MRITPTKQLSKKASASKANPRAGFTLVFLYWKIYPEVFFAFFLLLPSFQCTVVARSPLKPQRVGSRSSDEKPCPVLDWARAAWHIILMCIQRF
jgi:hypothetical protein